MRHRLFVAIRPPAPIIERLLVIQGGIDGARWQDEGQLHLTLRFVGEVEARQAEELVDALASVSAPPFELALHGVGYFEKKGRTHTLWAGLAPSDALAALARRVDTACRRAGLPAEPRKFMPHITVARLGAAAGPVLPFLQQQATLNSPPWQVEAFDLMESTLSPAGAEYESVVRFRLRS